MQATHVRYGGTNEEEIALWRQVAKENQAAYASLFKRYSQILYGYGLGICPDETLVEDCIQEFFMRLWARRKSLSEPRSVKAYMLASVRRLILEAVESGHKRTRRYQSSYFYTTTTDLSYEQLLIESQLVEQRNQMLQQYLDQLTNRQREVVYLRFFQNSSFKEISETLNIDLQSVRNLLCRALKKMREASAVMAEVA
ncbi:RNA polymerase sigma-70 factor, ECF subfamily [Catalinimonas alkaloidigena]|uniref:RNA polymerase sigma-70 factor, ECF subfamily n=1 Tax=Catalinimonas alkaloidigena TaxID=1075417 RepID=A0A1G9SV06_9BACT|nr:sigma-70 family RNA polymerase sigma factor [Catalinimonas alkaloidigena]SDM39272.1 RNA polymerase sigma-70 factor, ECF subfamily [Catalinimonas alkaloidigena]